jgi:hypothetical protein
VPDTPISVDRNKDRVPGTPTQQATSFSSQVRDKWFALPSVYNVYSAVSPICAFHPNSSYPSASEVRATKTIPSEPSVDIVEFSVVVKFSQSS